MILVLFFLGRAVDAVDRHGAYANGRDRPLRDDWLVERNGEGDAAAAAHRAARVLGVLAGVAL